MINVESIKTENDKIYISIKLKPFCNRNFRNNVTCDTADIENILKEKRISYGECLQETHLSNRREKTCSGIWVFKKPQTQKKSNRNRRSKKNQKNLDKVVEDVIIDSVEQPLEE